MKAGIYTSFDNALPISRSIPMIREAGFEVVSLGARDSGYTTREGRRSTASLLQQHGMTIESVHAPFPEGDRLFSPDEAERLESLRQCKLAIDAAAELDGKVVVIHLIQPYGIPPGELRDRMIDQGRRSVESLVDYCAHQRIRLALENGQRLEYDEVLIDLLTEFNDVHVGFCYDSGHENVQGTCFNLLERFGHRLFTLHIHDNHGADTHILPYEGTIDWERFRAVIHGLAFTGSMLLEVHTDHSEFKDHAHFLAEARARAGRLIQPL